MLNQNNMNGFWGKTMSITIAMIVSAMFIFAKTANAITREDAKNMVLNKIIGKDVGKVDVYLWKSMISSTDSVRLLNKTLSCPYASNWVFFVDDMPVANWCHPCRYVFVDTTTGNYNVITERIHPQGFDPEKYDHFLELVSGTPRLQQKSFPKVKNNNSAAKVTTVTNSNLFAVIINGCDWGRYWRDISAIYCTLIDVYGFSKDNIFVHYVEGTSYMGDDLDGPDVPSDDIDYDAYISTIERTFRNLSGEWTNDPNVPELGPEDQLFVFIDDHGDWESGTTHVWAILPGTDDLDDFELADFVENINCAQMIFVMEPCFSGGFIDDLADYENYDVKCEHRDIQTACDYNESSICEMHITDWKYDEFVFYWTAAARGYYPVINEPWEEWFAVGSFPFENYTTMTNHPPDYDPDTNGDGVVQMEEAFDYSNNWDTWSHDGYFCPCPPYTYYDEYPQESHNIGFQEDLLSIRGLSGTISNSQTVSGNFLVSGDLTIENAVILTIEDGSIFNFSSNIDDQYGGFATSKCELVVHGKLKVDGVTFTSTGAAPGDWYGIVLDQADNSSYIKNSVIEYGSYGIYCISCSPIIGESNNVNIIQYNSGNGIKCSSASPTLHFNRIHHNGIGVFCQSNSHPYIKENYIEHNNSYGIYCTQTCNPYIRHNEVSHNSGGGGLPV